MARTGRLATVGCVQPVCCGAAVGVEPLRGIPDSESGAAVLLSEGAAERLNTTLELALRVSASGCKACEEVGVLQSL
jgi:hypothetical protein